MPFVNLNIPVLVQNIQVDEKPVYYFRPAFLTYPIASHRHYDLGLARFTKEVRNLFNGYTLEHSTMNHLLWFMFNPTIQTKQLQLDILFGKQNVSGKFFIVFFDLRHLSFVLLPALDNYMFILQKGEQGVDSLKDQIGKVVKKRLRILKEKAGQDFDPSKYLSPKKEFITTASVQLNINHPDFSFGNSFDNWLFSSLPHQEDFNGAIEIEKVGIDINGKYPAELRRAYCRDERIDQLSRLVFHGRNIPLAIIGQEGVGKHTLIEEAVWQYEDNRRNISENSKKQLWHIDPTRIISGMSAVGMWQKRFEAILQYLIAPFPGAKFSHKILIDNGIALFRIGKSSQNNLTLSDVLKPYMEKRKMQVILLATPEEWKVIQGKDRKFSDLFQVIRLAEPDYATAVKMVLQQTRNLERENDCEITVPAIRQLFTFHRNYWKNKALPGSIVKVLRQMTSKYRFQTLDVVQVIHEFRNYSGFEEKIYDHTYTLERNEIRDIIGGKLIGQQEAIEALSDVVHLIKAKLCDPGKPLGSLFFIGPTGVGKTHAAKVLCEYIMGDEKQLMRFDMNEYVDEWALQRLIGDKDQPEGLLTGKVRYQPFGVLLFDEIEKAHPLIHDLLLQVLDDGRLTDSLGQTTDFTNTIIIMTSNLGAGKVASQLGFETKGKDDSSIYRSAIEDFFKPEFVNRIDKIIAFQPLQKDQIRSIARLQIKELLQRDGFLRRNTILNISHEALGWVAQRGFDKKMGGRALKRQIEQDLTTLSAEQLIRTNANTPIFFEIRYDGKRLLPVINPLRFVEMLQEDWLFKLTETTKGKRFYVELLKNLDTLESKVNLFEEGRDPFQRNVIVIGNAGSEDINWQYYHFKNKLSELKEHIRNLLLGFRDRHFRELPATAFRLKRAPLFAKKGDMTKGVRENFKDRLFQKEAIKELSETNQFGNVQFDSAQTEFIQNFLDVAFLKLSARGFFEGKADKVQLKIQSCISGMGDEEIKFLLGLYDTFFTAMDIQHTVLSEQNSIIAEGYSLFSLLGGEDGIHLFYKVHNNPLPIRLHLHEIQSDESSSKNAYKVIRIYDSRSTLTDLRTGFTNAIHPTTSEFKLLLYAGIGREIRQRLANHLK